MRYAGDLKCYALKKDDKGHSMREIDCILQTTYGGSVTITADPKRCLWLTYDGSSTKIVASYKKNDDVELILRCCGSLGCVKVVLQKFIGIELLKKRMATLPALTSIVCYNM